MVIRRRKRKKRIVGQKGGYRPKYKLTEEQVREIWKLIQEGKLSQTEIAKMYGVGQEAISHISTGSRWNQVTGLPKRTKESVGIPPSKFVHGRPRKRTLRHVAGTKRAGIKHYRALEKAAVNCLMREGKFVRVKFKELVNFPKDFPYRRIEKLDETGVIEMINAAKLLTWLHEHGYSNYYPKMIAEQLKIVSGQIAWITRIYGLGEL